MDDRYCWTATSPKPARGPYADALGHGVAVAVAGLELGRGGSQPLHVRHVDPGSPAAAAGIQRGDRVTQIAGRAAREVIAADDFTALTASTPGQTLALSARP